MITHNYYIYYGSVCGTSFEISGCLHIKNYLLFTTVVYSLTLCSKVYILIMYYIVAGFLCTASLARVEAYNVRILFMSRIHNFLMNAYIAVYHIHMHACTHAMETYPMYHRLGL